MELVSSKKIWINILAGSIAGIITLIILKRFLKGKSVGDIAEVKLGRSEVRYSELYVDDIYDTDLLGTENSRKLVQSEGMAAVI
ncbi:hypothetical protein GOM49_11245 [Clostridium bovifaecis]|uniref:Uncharacterized protein n=1 Tax=Clostridium bovifaecis TaxID=2184719 RepID=A0A6I6EZ60_9CLOT|nr:hypothetical protein GOM49_11245 [Clostridium bovifaecis]